MTVERRDPGRPSADRTPGTDSRGSAGAAIGGGALGRWVRNGPRRLAGRPPISRLKVVLDTYAAVGGGLLASGLAFGALFALIPAALLVVGVAGLFVSDPQVRVDVVREIAGRIPPLESYVAVALDQIAAGAAGLSLIGLVGLAWTAARFYGQLDEAFALVFRSPGRRGFLERTVRALVAVGLICALYVVLVWVSILVAHAPSELVDAIGGVRRLRGPLVGFAIAALIVALVYRIVPTQRVPWRAISLPAVIVAFLEELLTGSYVLIAPLLASPAVFGPFVTAFATLVWLSWTFQLLLLGAAWIRVRTDGSGVDAGVSTADD